MGVPAQWQRSQNCEQMLLAAERAGAPREALPCAKKLADGHEGAWRSYLWAAASAVLMPSLAPEASVRAEVSRLCTATTKTAATDRASTIGPPGAVNGVLPVAAMLETAGAHGALLLWLRTAARSGGLGEPESASLEWPSIFGSGAAVDAIVRTYSSSSGGGGGGGPLVGGAADELFGLLRGGEESCAKEEVAAAAAAVLYASLTTPAAERRAALQLQKRFVAIRTRRKLRELRSSLPGATMDRRRAASALARP